MITYELAKKLKKAGFPQDMCQWYFVNKNEIRVKKWAYPYDGSVFTPDKKSIAIPTLSELIEACGDKIQGLAKIRDEETINSLKDEINAICDIGDWMAVATDEVTLGIDESMEEAVANLWLKIK
ncbi:MAG: hypothetical protein AABY22_36990 [Nanoarchaeota archaeon]